MNEGKKITAKQLIFGIIGIAIVVALVICFVVAYNNTKTSNNENNNSSSSSSNITANGKNVSITNGGSYELAGEYESVTVNTDKDVTLNLNNAEITNSNGPGINVVSGDTVTINLSGTNKVTATTTEDLDGAIYSKADLVFSGTGSLEVKSNYDGIVSKDTLVIENGTYTINTDDDGIRGKDSVEISDGTFTINASGDGIKSTNDEDSTKGYISIEGGTFNIACNNDAVQAETTLNIKAGTFEIKTTGTISSESDSSKGLKAGILVTIDGGTYNINSKDDAVHSNGNITINTGNFTINTDDDAFHADSILTINDGTTNVQSCYEGFEGGEIYIKGGNNSINASDDGINAASSDSSATQTNGMNGRDNFKNSTGVLEISGGTTKVISAGDGLDSNGTITISGGKTYVESSNNGPEEAIDHVGTMNITGGTLISIAKNMANDDGTKTTTIPYVNTSVNSGSGAISIGNISYTPTISGYKYIFIVSSELTEGANTLKYGSNSMEVTATTGTISNNMNGNGFGGQQGDMQNGGGPQGGMQMNGGQGRR